MQEVEVKILEIDKPAVIKKLEQLGAKKVFAGMMQSYFYDLPDKQLQQQKKTLRLREAGSFSLLTYKQKIPNTEVKVRQEYETKLSDPVAIKKIFKELNLIVTRISAKYRESYALGDVHVELDTIEGIPTYLEIEATTVEALKKTLQELGFSKKDAKPWTEKDVMEFYKKNNKL